MRKINDQSQLPWVFSDVFFVPRCLHRVPDRCRGSSRKRPAVLSVHGVQPTFDAHAEPVSRMRVHAGDWRSRKREGPSEMEKTIAKNREEHEKADSEEVARPKPSVGHAPHQASTDLIDQESAEELTMEEQEKKAEEQEKRRAQHQTRPTKTPKRGRKGRRERRKKWIPGLANRLLSGA